MTTNVVGLFDTTEQAQMAIRRLIADGIESTNVSLVVSDPKGTIRTERVDRSGEMATEGMVAGATSGLVVGGLIGLLVGATTVAIPGAGFLLAGPIVGMVTGMSFGMAGGTILGALVGLGLPEEEAHIYAESIRRGSLLVIVHVDESNRLFVEQILSMAGAANIVERGNLYRSSGFVGYDASAPVYTEEEALAERQRYAALPPLVTPPVSATIGEELYIPDDLFMDDYWSNYAQTGLAFADVRDAYRFGYDLATRPEFRNLDWTQAVTDAKNLWEQNHLGTWDQYRGAIHVGWSKAGVRANSGASLI